MRCVAPPSKENGRNEIFIIRSVATAGMWPLKFTTWKRSTLGEPNGSYAHRRSRSSLSWKGKCCGYVLSKQAQQEEQVRIWRHWCSVICWMQSRSLSPTVIVVVRSLRKYVPTRRWMWSHLLFTPNNLQSLERCTTIVVSPLGESFFATHYHCWRPAFVRGDG